MTVASELVERLYIGYSYDSVHLPLLLAGYGGKADTTIESLPS